MVTTKSTKSPKKKDARGGARERAGRKKGITKKSYSFSLPIDLGELVNSRPKPSAVVEKALKQFLTGNPEKITGSPNIEVHKPNPFKTVRRKNG